MPDKKDLYTVEGDKIVRKNPFCPRCGEGVFMADHGDRFACGKCGYKTICGGCRARSAYYHDGDILQEDSYCAFGKQLTK